MKIKELFSDKSKWTQGVAARDKDGNHCPYNDENAVCWCLLGALYKCYGDIQLLTQNFNSLWDKTHGVAMFNDSHTFEEVKQLVEELDV